MGGTFNPIHNAHVIMAQIAYKELQLDEVWMMPSNIPPHKEGISIATAQDRSRMIQLAIEGIPGLVFSDFELKREGKTYSVDTMKALRVAHPQYEFYFIIGADSLFAIDTWYHPEILLPLMTTVVFAREHKNKTEMIEQIKVIEQRYHCHMVYLEMEDIPVSSTVIRKSFLERKKSPFLSDKVYDYILEKGLYQ